MLVAISFFRNSGLFEILSNGISFAFSNIGVSKEIPIRFRGHAQAFQLKRFTRFYDRRDAQFWPIR
jgi:hypothetical protein